MPRHNQCKRVREGYRALTRHRTQIQHLSVTFESLWGIPFLGAGDFLAFFPSNSPCLFGALLLSFPRNLGETNLVLGGFSLL